MAHYQTLMQTLKGYISAYDEFENRGKQAVAAVLNGFAQYLEAPAGSCRAGPPGIAIDANPTTPLDRVAELQEDGWFSGCLLVKELSPLGVMVRFTFMVRIEDDSTTLRMEHDSKEFRIREFGANSLKPFFDHVFNAAIESYQTSPARLASGMSRRSIGFT